MSHSEQMANPPMAEPDLTGRKLGDYRLLRRLGRGGMGEVYLAEQESLGRQVAFKILRPSLASDTGYVQRFMYEARAAAQLTHANIVQIYEVGTREGIHFIAQEYVPGQNLKQLLTRRGRPLELGPTIGIMRQVSAALQKAGEQAIVHRDIKPENILLTPEGEVKVADFGLARVTNDSEAMHLTQLGMTMGSPLYMSPEQAEGRPVDPRSDLYSFGATCYHMLAGRPPFAGETALALAVQHLKAEPPPLLQARPDLPEGICRIVHRLLAKKPNDRFNSAMEVLKALRALKSEGVSEELLDGLEGWSTPELIAMSDARYAATQRLGELLHTQAMNIQRPAPWWLPIAVVLAGLFAGVVLARMMRPEKLLEASRKVAKSDIPRLATSNAQWSFADITKTEAAWKAVEEYFPPGENATNLQNSRKALKGLADFYRRAGRFREAEQEYEKLTQLDSAEQQFRSQGYAGLALVYDLQARPDDARRELAQAWDRRHLLDAETRAELEQLRERLLE